MALGCRSLLTGLIAAMPEPAGMRRWPTWPLAESGVVEVGDQFDRRPDHRRPTHPHVDVFVFLL